MPRDLAPAIVIRSLRSVLGMTQEAFGRELSVGQDIVSDWERGEYAPAAENYVNLVKLAVEHDRFSEASRFVEQLGTGTGLFAVTSHYVEESRSRRDAAYREAFTEAKAIYPTDETARHRFAMNAARRALRVRARKEKRK